MEAERPEVGEDAPTPSEGDEVRTPVGAGSTPAVGSPLAPEVSASVRALLNERRRALAPPKPEPEPVAVVAEPVVLPQTAADLREAFQKGYFALLLEPEVMAAVRRQLRSSKNAKGAREILAVILPALVPTDKGGGGNGASRVTLISKVDRSGTVTATKVETG